VRTYMFFAILNDGTVKGWGYGGHGQLGMEGTNYYNVSTPTNIPGLAGAKQLAVSLDCAYAVMNDDTVKVAGRGTNGALGLGAGIVGNTNRFTTIPGLSNVVKIYPLAHSAIVKLNDGTFKGWGQNNHGQLALDGTDNKYSPTSIPNLTGFREIYGGEYGAYGIKNDGTAWGWGYNYRGELGLGNETQYKTPQLLPLANVSKFMGGLYSGFAIFGLVSSWDLGYEDIGSGWRWLSWFEYYAPLDNTWIWHNEHGYMYCFPSSTPQSIYFYTMDMGWLWTSSTVYPYLYRFSGGSWLWYQVGSSGPRWFYNFTAGQWESH
jgi:alpha-tubulin suppressor-like RCC1 family protein